MDSTCQDLIIRCFWWRFGFCRTSWITFQHSLPLGHFAAYLSKLWTDFDEICWRFDPHLQKFRPWATPTSCRVWPKGRVWPKDQLIRFWWPFGSGFGRRIPDSGWDENPDPDSRRISVICMASDCGEYVTSLNHPFCLRSKGQLSRSAWICTFISASPLKKSVKERIALHEMSPITELRGVTCHMGLHRVTRHPT